MGTSSNFYKNPSFIYNKDFDLNSVLQNLRAYNVATENAQSEPESDITPTDKLVGRRKRRRKSKKSSDETEGNRRNLRRANGIIEIRGVQTLWQLEKKTETPILNCFMDLQQASSIEDIFDSSLNLEDTHYNEGYLEGYTDGLASGKDEGRQVGLKSGFEIGEELGFYRGCIDLWASAIQLDSTCFSSRVQKIIKQMNELVSKYPLSDPENESVTDIMDSLRLKFRAICATLNVKLEYNGDLKASKATEMQF